ncbi:MAG: sortase, partial [Clostridia bacterium]|nr:sortase [Clostridia bacterium]
ELSDLNAQDSAEESDPKNLESLLEENLREHLNNNSKPRNEHSGRRRLISNLLIVAGLLLIAVPLVMTYINTKRNEAIIDEFMRQSEQAIQEAGMLADENVEDFYVQPGASQNISSEGVTEAAALTGEAITSGTDSGDTSSDNTSKGTTVTNGAVSEAAPTPVPKGSQASSKTPSKPKPPSTSIMSKEEITKRMTGVLIIKKINLRMIIMDGVDKETLRVAAGRMPNTGKLGEIGNCVLAGHRSYTFGKYFNRLDELDVGDEITVQMKDKTLTYKVYKKLIVTPDDFSITNQTDKDKVLTLFTCHPIVVASHRLVIHAKLVE